MISTQLYVNKILSQKKKIRKNKLRWCWILSSRCGDRAFRSHSPAGSRKWTPPRLPVTSVGSTLNSTTGTPFDATSGAKRHAWTILEDKLPQSIDHSHLVFVVLYKKLYHLGSLWTKLYRVKEVHHNSGSFLSGKRVSSAYRSGAHLPTRASFMGLTRLTSMSRYQVHLVLKKVPWSLRTFVKPAGKWNSSIFRVITLTSRFSGFSLSHDLL